MLKRLTALVLLLAVALACFTACGGKTPAKKNRNPVTPTENTDAALLASAEQVAAIVAEATMVYDLTTIQTYSLLGLEDSERILDSILGEIRMENGEYEWDGVYCGTYGDFVRIYDEQMNRDYEFLEITQVDAQLYEDTQILSQADTLELMGRDETGIQAYYSAVESVSIERVAVVEYAIRCQDQQTADPHTGEPEVHEEISLSMTVYLVLVDGQWRSYSPSLPGTFPPLAHFPRYTQ